MPGDRFLLRYPLPNEAGRGLITLAARLPRRFASLEYGYTGWL